MDKLYLQEQERETKLNSELKLLSERNYKIIQEIFDLKTKEKNLEAEVNGSIVTINNLQSKTNKFIETTRTSLSSDINITSTNYSIISIDLAWFVYGIHLKRTTEKTIFSFLKIILNEYVIKKKSENLRHHLYSGSKNSPSIPYSSPFLSFFFAL